MSLLRRKHRCKSRYFDVRLVIPPERTGDGVGLDKIVYGVFPGEAIEVTDDAGLLITIDTRKVKS